MTAPRHVLLELDDDGDLQTVHEDNDDRSVSSEALCISSSATSFSEDGARTASSQGKRRTNPVVDGQLVPKSGPRSGPMRKRRRDGPAAAPSPRARRR